MRKQFWGKLFILLALTFALFAFQPQAEETPVTPQLVYLSDILKNPSHWLGIPVRVPLRFSRLSNVYTPFFTQFAEEQYINFSAWDVRTPIWDKEAFSTDYPFFYVEKDNLELKSFFKLKAFDTISVVGKVTSLFRQKPYFRITWVCRIPGTIDVDTLRTLNKGMKAFNNKKFDETITILSKLLPGEEEAESTYFPPHDIQMMIHKLIAKIHMYEKKDFQGALVQLDKALLVNPKDYEANELRMKCDLCLQGKIDPPLPSYFEEGDKKPVAKPEESKTETKEVKPVVPAEIPQLPMPSTSKEEIQ